MTSFRASNTGTCAALLCATAVAMTTPALAADPPPPDGKWLGAGQGGLLFSSGNSKAASVNAKIDLARTDGVWKNTMYLGGLYGKSADIVSAERIEGRYQLDRKMSERMFWFAGLDANKDQFSGFNYQATMSAGLGYKFIDTAGTKLSGTLGVGYQRLQTQQLIKDAAGAVVQRINGAAQGSAVGTAGLNLEQTLTATTRLTNKLFVTSGSLNTSIGNDLGIAVSMSEALALSLGYGIRYNTDPAPGVRKLDQVTTVNLVYKIK